MVAIFIHLFALSRLMKHLDAIQISSTFFMQLTDSGRLASEEEAMKNSNKLFNICLGGTSIFQNMSRVGLWATTQKSRHQHTSD